MKAWRNLDGFRGESSFKTWIFAIATNCWKDHIKRVEPVKPAGEEMVVDICCPRLALVEVVQRRQEVRRLRQASLTCPKSCAPPCCWSALRR